MFLRNIFKIFIFLTLFITPVQASDDAIIAVVNDELITFKDLQDYIHQTYVTLSAQGLEERQLMAMMKEMEKNGLQQLIEDKLILSEAKKLGLTVRDKLVDKKVDEIKTRYGTDENFEKSLVKHGATISDLRKKIEDGLRIKYVIEHEVKSKIFVNPQEVTDYYEKNPNRFQTQEKINLESVSIAFGNDKTAAREKAKEVMEAVKSGKDFAEIVKEYSESPSIGVIERGQLLASIEDAVFRLELDEVSKPLETDTGIYIFKLKGRTRPQTTNLADVKQNIYEYLYQEKFRERLTQWVNKLKNEAYVEIKG